MLGATGAVGSHCARALMTLPRLHRLTTLGRRPLEGFADPRLEQHTADIFDPASYAAFLPDHDVAICTLGVGQPSKMSREDFLKIDKLAVVDFARACRRAGVRHFQLLGSLAADATSRSFYLRAKGELEEELRALDFQRLSLFRPSMILTPNNRYGFLQGLTLLAWPLLSPLLLGGLRKFRGIAVDKLGRALAINASIPGSGVEILQWDEMMALADRDGSKIAP